MKVENQSIPEELKAAFFKLLSAIGLLPDTQYTLKTKPLATKPVPKKKKSRSTLEYEKAVDFLIEYLTEKNGEPPLPGFKLTQVNKLKKGEFDTTYWKKCSIESELVIQSIPTSTDFVGPRRYDYPQEEHEPSIPTYPVGTDSSGDPAYTGTTTGLTFRDTSLKFKRTIFKLGEKVTKGDGEPLFLKMTGTISADADMRCSRAFLSVILKRWIVANGSSHLTSKAPPTVKPMSFYWRYTTIRGTAPYSSTTRQVEIIKLMRARRDYEEAGELTKAVIYHAPMPMMGKRFNNNDDVTSTLVADLELWQISRPVHIIVGHCATPSGSRAWRWSLADGMVNLGVMPSGTNSFALGVSADGNTVVGYGAAPGGNRAFRWTESEGMINLGVHAGGSFSDAYGANEGGNIICGSGNPNPRMALKYQVDTSTWSSLSTVSANRPAIAFAISAAGTEIVGSAYPVAGEFAFRWKSSGGFAALTELPDTNTSTARNISKNGLWVVGHCNTDTGQFACIWDNDGAVSIIPGLIGTEGDFATAVSEDGQYIAGYSIVPTGVQGWRWDAVNGHIEVPFLPAGDQTSVNGISSDGQMLVGTGNTSGVTRAFYWTEAEGTVLLPLLPTGTNNQARAVT